MLCSDRKILTSLVRLIHICDIRDFSIVRNLVKYIILEAHSKKLGAGWEAIFQRPKEEAFEKVFVIQWLAYPKEGKHRAQILQMPSHLTCALLLEESKYTFGELICSRERTVSKPEIRHADRPTIGVPDRTQRLSALSAQAALAIFVFGFLMLCPSSKMTLCHGLSTIR